jgi:hypothetical protein
MNKMYEIEYHINGQDLYRTVVTADGRSARENRTPTCVIRFADEQARALGACRFRIHLYKPPHITASGFSMGIAHLVYESEVSVEAS